MRSAVSHDDGRIVNASRQWTWAASIRPNSVPRASVAVTTSSSRGAAARPVTSPAPTRLRLEGMPGRHRGWRAGGGSRQTDGGSRSFHELR